MPSTVTASPAVELGIDRLLETDRSLVAGRRIGVVCNPASVDRALRHTSDRVSGDPDMKVLALFGPQHGFRSDVQDNMIETPHGRDGRRAIPVYSLYSETREPTAEMLKNIDVLVIDLQDVGTRVYTYIYTMANCMRAAAKNECWSSFAIDRIRLAASTSKAADSTPLTRRLSDSFRFRCVTA